MARLLRDETLVASWKKFFEEHYKSEIETIAQAYPQKRSLVVDFDTIDRYDTTLSEGLVEHPYKYIFNAEQALKSIDTAAGFKQIHFRATNLSDVYKISIRDLRSERAAKFVSVEGLVKKRTKVKGGAAVAAFQCNKCGVVILVEQDEDILKEPGECYEDQGGCGRVSSFRFSTNLSTFIDDQKILLQENPEGLRGGEQPQDIETYLADDLVGKIEPGDRIRVNGILHMKQNRRGAVGLRTFDFCLEAVGIEINESLFEEIEITEENKKEIKKASEDPDIYIKMQRSIAPTIYGMELEKEALVLQLFGGVPKVTSDGTKLRGDIHVLFMGDPSTAKSQLLAYMHRLAPRSVFTSGSGSTKAGLTATAVKDDFSEGKWALDAGALVMADGGLVCIDEFDKMHEEDKGGMNEAMEQQEISVAKAGINATLKARCSVLAAANPKTGRFDTGPGASISAQINIKPALLSRFDLIFPIIDKPNREQDMAISKHILETHQNPMGSKILPIYPPDFIRKYVAYAKQNVRPKLTDEAMEIIQNFYVDYRNKSDESIPFTSRQLEAFIRLAEASARVRLSDKATIEDAKRAIMIVDAYLLRVAIDDETGKIDYDIIATGHSHSQHERMKSIIALIKRLCSESGDGNATRSDVVSEAEIYGMESGKVEDALDRLKRNGQIYESMHGKYRITEY